MKNRRHIADLSVNLSVNQAAIRAAIRAVARVRRFRSAVLMVATMLALPILLAACGKSEWREVKAPETALQASPPAAASAAPPVAPSVQTSTAAPVSTPVSLDDKDPDVPNATVPVTPRADSPASVVREVRMVPVGPVARAIPPVTPAVSDPVNQTVPLATATPQVPATIKPVAQPVQPRVVVPAVPRATAPVKSRVAEKSKLGAADRYIMIQNIATEKMRVYERSAIAGEPNKLIFETDLIAGENDPGRTRRTALGSYRIEKWIKFYQDNQGLFPSWWNPENRDIPLPGAELQDWTLSHLMPVVNGQPRGVVRGAFGWYTAKIGPNAHEQWTHGTVGWGLDRDRFIKIPKTQLAQFYSDPRSFGCTRVENRAIAFLHDLLPVGTRVLKVYARESLADTTLARYKGQAPTHFEFALTNDEVRVENPHSAERAKQILRHVPEDAVIETGTYELDQTPDAVPFKKTTGKRRVVTLVSPEANLYDLKETSFHGEFLVDEGRFVNYKHPSELRKGGFKDPSLPKVVLK